MLAFARAVIIAILFATPCFGQNESDNANDEGVSTIVLEARGKSAKPPALYSATAKADIDVREDRIEQTIQLAIKVIQGEAKTLSLGLNGPGEVESAKGPSIKSWSVRTEGNQRFLDLQLKKNAKDSSASVVIRSPEFELPAAIQIAHLTSGAAVGFDSRLNIKFDTSVEGTVVQADGFTPLSTPELPIPTESPNHFQTTTGGTLKLSLNQSGASPARVELSGMTLTGELHDNGDSMGFKLKGTATVSKSNSEISILSGHAAISKFPPNKNYRLRLATNKNQPTYQLVFKEAGEFPIELDFVAKLIGQTTNEQGIDFSVAASAVVPIKLSGLDENLEFHRAQDSIVPQFADNAWSGFLPVTGRARLSWKTASKTGEGKLFFTTSGLVESQVGAGLLRQNQLISYQVLQGELPSISMQLTGPGEVLDVQGNNIVAWKVTGDGEDRQLDVTLSQPITATSTFKIRSQTPIGAFPARTAGLRLNPIGAIRHSGFLRLSNLGSVRVEPTGLSGLTQLSPDQFPAQKINARQIFVYRFPAADHDYTIVADRIQPEVNVSELILYQLAEADRVIRADIELDIREAPIREVDFLVPADYSVVAVTGPAVSDYIAASDVADGKRNLKVIFAKDIAGRQLVNLRLEKSQAAAAENWTLPRIEYPEAKSLRGDIGVVGAAGFRVSVSDANLLVEKPLSYFPKPIPGLQQAFRIRERDWSATMKIELLQRSVQSDVFHLYSLNQETVYGSALINYFVAGAPVSEWKIAVPASLENVLVDGQDVRTWRREGDTLIVTLHQPVMGSYTLLVTSEEKPGENDGTFKAGQVAPIGVQGERGYVQVVSPMQVEMKTESISDDVLKLDALELPAEFRLLSAAPALGTWQYTQRPFDLRLNINWFQPGTMTTQVVEFSEANSRVSRDGELVTEVLYYVKSRGRRSLKIKLPGAPVRLWEVSVNGQPVTARQADDATLIPLPGGTDPNSPMEVRLRLGKPSVNESNPRLSLPIVDAPVLKTQWKITGDEKHLLVPNGGTVTPATPVLRPSGFEWLAKRGLGFLLVIGILTVIGVALRNQTRSVGVLGLLCLIIAMGTTVLTANTAFSQAGNTSPLQLSLPVLSAGGEAVELSVSNTPLWRADLSWWGVTLLVVGIAVVVWSYLKSELPTRTLVRASGVFLIALALLYQRGGAGLFFVVLGCAIFVFLFVVPAWRKGRDFLTWCKQFLKERKEKQAANVDGSTDPPAESGGAVTATILFLATTLSLGGLSANADKPLPSNLFMASDSISQNWEITQEKSRLIAKGTVQLSGKPGDQFLLLKGPAVLTSFEGKGLRLTKQSIQNLGLCYVMTVPLSASTTEPKDNNESNQPDETAGAEATDTKEFTAKFEYQIEAVQPASGIPVLMGTAALHEIDLTYDEPGWGVASAAAVRIEMDKNENRTAAKILLGLGEASLILRPKARDFSTEETQFFVEASNLYLPGPGVVDGRHRIYVRTSQGQIDDLSVVIPDGLTVSSVTGPVGSWQFDADNGQLQLDIEPAQSKPFLLEIQTQRGLDPLPADAKLSPLAVTDANGQVGLVAVAFGPDAQPEKMEADGMSAVNLSDFDASMIEDKQAVLHKVYRYGVEGGELDMRVAPVKPEVRVTSTQVLSLGDERMVLGVNFSAEITRAGLFQLSFPLPDGLEIESLSGAALHHWAELSEGDQRRIILHLNGKTIGAQAFSLSLSGPAPTDPGDWKLPRFELTEATRQSGELVVRPTTGIRLRTVTRQNVSAIDPRSMGGTGQGALAFRLLQKDWNLVLGIEKLDPWVTGHVLHDVTLREGQTRSALIADFNIQNASIRSLQVSLPITNDDEIKTVRTSGDTISDLIRTAPNSNIWEVHLKRRVVGRVQFRIEYERRGDRPGDNELLRPAEFPQARQLGYYFAVRTGGRLELEHEPLEQGWQSADWNMIPTSLRQMTNRNSPALTFRSITPPQPLIIHATRHSLAESLKLRVANGSLTTVLSPTGDQLTSVDVTMDVLQRSSLNVGLPTGGELFSIFVNGESVNSIRVGGGKNGWQFYILPGMDDRTANVRFVYSVPGNRLSRLNLTSPEMNVPLENIQWKVVAPKGFELVDNDGNLELIQQSNRGAYDRSSYLSKVKGKRQDEAQQAAQLLDRASQLLQEGEQSKARRALNSVANRYALDAASNEDARVQLENLQTQQAIVGLNTRRQRLYLDNNAEDAGMSDNQQLREAAAVNPILQKDAMNFRPQELSQLLRGNTQEDNAVLQKIAARLVQHQHTTDPAPQAIVISLPEEGPVYTFSRSVQVAENAPLELDLDFASRLRIHTWQVVTAIMLLAALSLTFTFAKTKSE